MSVYVCANSSEYQDLFPIAWTLGQFVILVNSYLFILLVEEAEIGYDSKIGKGNKN